MVLDFDPGSPLITFVLSCPMAPPASFGPQPRWRDIYNGLYGSEASGSGFRARGWRHGSGGVFAEWIRTRSDTLASDETTMHLRHKPE
jgi:hypothetical protein